MQGAVDWFQAMATTKINSNPQKWNYFLRNKWWEWFQWIKYNFILTFQTNPLDWNLPDQRTLHYYHMRNTCGQTMIISYKINYHQRSVLWFDTRAECKFPKQQYITIQVIHEEYKTDVESRQSLRRLRSINANMIKQFTKQSPLPFSMSYMLSLPKQ